MTLSLRPADDQDRALCEALNRRNMTAYLAARAIPWDSARFLASWAEFENLMIMAENQVVGMLRLVPQQDAMGLRDLQVAPEHQRKGLGSWAVQQAQSIAASRGFRRLKLRVYQENPASALYDRLGFKAQSVDGGTVHMTYELPPGSASRPHPLRGSA